MAHTSEQELTNESLVELYERGVAAYGCGCPSTDEAEACFNALTECSTAVRELGVFSSNEEVTDVPTQSLKYLLIPYYLAMVRQRLPAPSSAESACDKVTARISLLERSRIELSLFLRKLETLGVLEKADATAHQDLLDSLQLHVSGDSLSGLYHTSTQPTSREKALEDRNRLMERTRRLIHAKKQLAALEERRKRLRLSEEQDTDAAEVEREHWLLVLQIQGAEAINELKGIIDERQMLQQAQKMGIPQARDAPRPSSSSASSSATSGSPAPKGPPKIFHISEPGATPQPLKSLADAPKPTAKPPAGSVPSSSAQPFSASRVPAPIRRGLLSPDEAAAAVEWASQTPGGGIAPGHVHKEQLGRVADGAQDRIGHRQLVKDAVFLPGWRQPTLMVEEAAEIEMQFAAKGPGGEDSRRKPDDDDEEARKANDDDELKKQREWDDWCDYNPTGIGNRKRQG